MTPRQAGIALALAHAAIVATLGAKLLVDRARLPRAWARTMPYDPDLPLRGRYVQLRLEVPLDSIPDSLAQWDVRGARLDVRDGRLVGALDTSSAAGVRVVTAGMDQRFTLVEPIAYFIPEHVPDPSIRPPGEELWAEVTIPRRGPPRPIRLGVWKDGTLTPLSP
jgi:hypothetical protein